MMPKKLFGLGKIINKFIATLPLIDNLCLSTYIVSRSLNFKIDKEQSCSIIIPCKNEKGNIETIVKKIPEDPSLKDFETLSKFKFRPDPKQWRI